LAIGGWQVSGITTFQKGFPFTILGQDVQGINDSQFMHANIVPGCKIKGNLNGQFARLNPACFTQPALGTYGTIGRNTLRQPGINNFDLGVGKDFAFTERIRFQIKADAFNAFNHHQYGGDVGGLLVAGSGGNTAIDSTVGDSKFGLITQSSKSREFQFSGKLTF
jgi:hypothetical protein